MPNLHNLVQIEKVQKDLCAVFAGLMAGHYLVIKIYLNELLDILDRYT